VIATTGVHLKLKADKSHEGALRANREFHSKHLRIHFQVVVQNIDRNSQIASVERITSVPTLRKTKYVSEKAT